MIIEYSRSARCKDCIFCIDYPYIKKNGEIGKKCIYRCYITEKLISPNYKVCNNWKLK